MDKLKKTEMISIGPATKQTRTHLSENERKAIFLNKIVECICNWVIKYSRKGTIVHIRNPITIGDLLQINEDFGEQLQIHLLSKQVIAVLEKMIVEKEDYWTLKVDLLIRVGADPLKTFVLAHNNQNKKTIVWKA